MLRAVKKVRKMRTFTMIKKPDMRKTELPGFTIIELLLVVVILGMLAGAAGYASVGRYQRLQVEKAAKGIFLAAKYARIIAVEKQRRCSLVLDTTENFFCLSISSSGGESIVSNAYTKPCSLAEGVSFEGISIAQINDTGFGEAKAENVIVFNPDGTAENAVLQIGDGKNHYTVYISAATGKAKIEFGEAKESSVDVIDLDIY